MKKDNPYLPCTGVGFAAFLCGWFVIGPLCRLLGFYLEPGPLMLFSLAAGVTGGVLFRLRQRLNVLEDKTAYLKERLDRLSAE